MQPYVMDQQWVRIGDSDSSPLAGNVRRIGMVVGRVVDRGGERQYGAEVHRSSSRRAATTRKRWIAVSLERAQTIMKGAPRCTFRYRFAPR